MFGSRLMLLVPLALLTCRTRLVSCRFLTGITNLERVLRGLIAQQNDDEADEDNTGDNGGNSDDGDDDDRGDGDGNADGDGDGNCEPLPPPTMASLAP